MVRILFRILGPIEALPAGGAAVPLGPPKQRAVLAVLLLRAGRTVSVHELVDALWPAGPPRSAVKNIQLYVCQLRRLLDGGLTTDGGGYRLGVETHRLDLTEFTGLTAEARRLRSAGDVVGAQLGYRRALALWRGPALADLAGRGLLASESELLEQSHLRVLDECVELELRLGRHQELIPELTRLVATHPLHERLRLHHIRALHEAGRTAEALGAYERARRVLAAELGVPPGRELRELADLIRSRTGERSRPDGAAPPALPPAAAGATDRPAADPGRRVAASGSPHPVPAQLPADVDDFTGREWQLGQIADFLAGRRATAMPICLVSGTAGVGKSCLAVRAAHQLRARFPDGQLHVNLHGSGPRRLDPADVLAQFLRALGMTDRPLPVDQDERVRLYRSTLADRRVLVVLDDAGDEDQVRPLLPGGAGCASIVTSRRRLAGIEGARTLTLDVLDLGQAVDLLATATGRDRVAAEPEAAEAIVRLCGRLPLAVRVAAARLAAREHWSLAEFTRRLADGRRRLDELRVGDLDIRAGFQLSYDSLDPHRRRAFRRLGLLDQPTVTGWVAAALWELPGTRAEDLLESLVDAQLLQVVRIGPGGSHRYRCHDLLHAYAGEKATAEEPAPARDRALDAVFDEWLVRAERAAGALFGAPPGPAVEAPDPRAWFADEQADLIALVAQAHRTGRWAVTWRLAQALTVFLEERAQWSAWRQTHELAQDAARTAGNAEVEAALTQRLGDLHRDRGQFDRAQELFQRSLELADALGHERARGYALRGLGDVHWGQGRVNQAVSGYERALRIFEAAGDARGAAYALRGLSVAYRGLGRLDVALTAGRECVAAFRSIGDRTGEAYARRTLGSVHLDRREFADAVACFERCLVDFAELGDRVGEGAALLGLGMAYVDEARFVEAVDAYQRCRVAFADVADPLGEAYAGRGLGDALAGLGRFAEALVELRRCLTVFVAHDDPRWQGYALLSLGGTLLAAGRIGEQAEAYLVRALAIFERLDAPLWQARTRHRLDRVRAGRGGHPTGTG